MRSRRGSENGSGTELILWNESALSPRLFDRGRGRKAEEKVLESAVLGSPGKYSFDAVPSGRGYVLSAIKDGGTQDSRSIAIRGGENRAIFPPLRLEGEQEASTNVRLYGKVYDAAGQPVSGASVKLENPRLQVSRGAVISSDGNYSFTEVPPGEGYKISVVRDGNTLESRSGLTVDPAKVNPDQVLLLYLKSH